MADSKNSVNDTAHFTFIWTIENMFLPCFVESPRFMIQAMEMTEWFLSLEVEDKFYKISFWRDGKEKSPKKIEVRIELSFLGIDGRPLIEREVVRSFRNGDVFDFDEFVDSNEIFIHRRKEFLPKDALTVRCRMWRTGTGISQLESCFSRTCLTPDGFFFVLAIREFRTLQKGQTGKICLRKIQECSPSNRTIQFAFMIFLTENDEEYVNISTLYSDADFSGFYATKIHLLDFEGKVVHSKKMVGYGNKIVLFESFIKKRRLMNDKKCLLPNDVLSLRCEVEIRGESLWNTADDLIYFNSANSNIVVKNVGEIRHCDQIEFSKVSSFTDAIKNLLQEGTLSDVSLKTNTKSFAAHKCILGARSPVFKVMFTGNMKEKKSKCVEISDVEDDALELLLSYIYTDTVGELEWEKAADLYRAADKYELLDLKARCSTILQSNLSMSNACAILIVADLYNDEELREATVQFLMMQKAEFFTSDIWRRFKEDCFKLYLEILERKVCYVKN